MERLNRGKRFWLAAVLLGVGLLFFIGYGREAAIPLRIAVLPGGQQQILQVAKQEAEKNGIQVEIVVCHDYMEPNSMLADGKVDANIYQSQEFLQNQITDCG
ncbi:MAG: MetQ/NlpA family ABC transporter substrate-binding protein, partial [Selenomonadaceae bacterium]